MLQPSRARNYFACVLVTLTIAVGGAGVSFAEEKGSPSARLKVLTESMDEESIDEIRKLIKAGADVNAKNRSGCTPLFMASTKGYTEIVKLLLASNADVNIISVSGATALLGASIQGHAEVVRILLAAKADVDFASKSGETALIAASGRGHVDVVKLLLMSMLHPKTKAYFHC